MYKKVVYISLILVLVLVNWSIYQKEQHIKNGMVVFLELAPVDPRSLMQGDYMALRFALAEKIYGILPKQEEYRRWQHNVDAADGLVVVHLDEKRVASFAHLYQGEPLKEHEVLMQYRIRGGAVKFATNAYFFEEGTAERYENAKYGEFRVNKKGELLLIAMANKNAKSIPVLVK